MYHIVKQIHRAMTMAMMVLSRVLRERMRRISVCTAGTLLTNEEKFEPDLEIMPLWSRTESCTVEACL